MEASGLYLLFASGKRPTRGALLDFTKTSPTTSISHDPNAATPLRVASPSQGEDARDSAARPAGNTPPRLWVELLREGLTFDLYGMAPGDACQMPETDHLFDLAQTPSAQRLEPVKIVVGHHLHGAANTLPVARATIALACEFVNGFDDLVAVVWQPSKSAIGRRYFESVASSWLEGGPFPALGLTAFRQTIDGALQTFGLDFWIGQELRIEPPLSSDRVIATRLGARIINHLVLMGGLDSSERIAAPDGSRLVMSPSANGKFVRVTRE